MTTKIERRLKIKARFRVKVRGTENCPRLCVFRSNKQIYVQFIDDEKCVTIVAASSMDKAIAPQTKGKTSVEVAALVGTEAAKAAVAKGIKEVAFDRGGYLYHGRVKSLADAARKGGLKF